MSFEVKHDTKKITLNEQENEIYNTLEKHFSKHYYDFNYPKTLDGDILDYYRILSKYLKDKGYGYASKLIVKNIQNKKINDLELARVLMDCNLIKKYKKSFISNIDNKSKFEYNKKDGLNKKFFIKYENDVTLSIEDVVYSNKDYINYQIDNENKKINFEIDIKANENINFTEIISVETTYGVDKLEFTVQCKIEKNNKIDLKNIGEFFELCHSDMIKALTFFKQNEFKEWLKEKNYSIELINYEKSILMHSTNSGIALRYFCMLNNVYIKDNITRGLKNKFNSSKHIDNQLKESKIEKMNKKQDDLLVEEIHKESIEKKTFIQKLKTLLRRR